jgi:hypothetical protein
MSRWLVGFRTSCPRAYFPLRHRAGIRHIQSSLVYVLLGHVVPVGHWAIYIKGHPSYLSTVALPQKPCNSYELPKGSMQYIHPTTPSGWKSPFQHLFLHPTQPLLVGALSLVRLVLATPACAFIPNMLLGLANLAYISIQVAWLYRLRHRPSRSHHVCLNCIVTFLLCPRWP